jgi:hypothetical protein
MDLLSETLSGLSPYEVLYRPRRPHRMNLQSAPLGASAFVMSTPLVFVTKQM